ncbi:unnamed protein product [Allacma fusca]|uniref:Large ribosomal subunit protein bL35m n=1 Tax=Allacma fusca TaxID=39272 RepID=A0A8J2KUL7_9HEXA|nr:unnamed protein product [Allacma fusca]
MAFSFRAVLKTLTSFPKIGTRNFGSTFPSVAKERSLTGRVQNGQNYCNTGIFSRWGPLGSNVPQRGFHLLKQLTPEVKEKLFPLQNGTPLVESSRGLVQYGFKGRRKTVKAVVHRFFRLDWGAWIRPRTGRHNKLWKKGTKQRKRARTHVFCNSQQSFMLDKMVTRFWHRKKYYVDDPYESYHTRPNFWITHRR